MSSRNPRHRTPTCYLGTEERADAENANTRGKFALTFRTSGGRYAVVDLQLSHPNKREIGPTLSVKSYLNPSGSRNLEYDPSKVAKAGNQPMRLTFLFLLFSMASSTLAQQPSASEQLKERFIAIWKQQLSEIAAPAAAQMPAEEFAMRVIPSQRKG